MPVDPEQFYSNNLLMLSKKLALLKGKNRLFGVTRFGTILMLLGVFYFFASLGFLYVILLTIALLAFFRWLVLRDLDNKSLIRQTENLVAVNKEEIEAVNGSYFQFNDGNAYTPPNHFYANDLDITGHASLFQFCNRTISWMGSSRLAAWLLAPAPASDIPLRQEAIRELTTKRSTGQLLQASGRDNPVQEKTFLRLSSWLKEGASFSDNPLWTWLRILVPVIMSSVTVAVIFDIIPLNVFYGFLFIAAVLAYQLNKKVAPVHDKLSKMVDELSSLSEGIALIEGEDFKSSLLNDLRNCFVSDNTNASQRLGKLKKILDRLDLRYNIVVSAPLNLLFLWNLQQVLDLEKWKKENAAEVEGWFDKIGDFEALNSLATTSFNNPDWAFPEISSPYFHLTLTTSGHPLIKKDRRVDNDVSISKKGELMIVTGSNMAGKSTYLRSVGINIVLAMAGSPVCATSCKLSPVNLLSSMRIFDNLEENTSTFYAELKKLKLIIDKVNAGEEVFVLLDEILRGTNSLDRHTGSVALIKQFIKHHAAAIIATHDVTLAQLIKEYPENIINQHFDAQVDGEELYFDYKLKPGISTSLNASILMKKIGIEL